MKTAPRPAILMYHRINQYYPEADSWQLTVSSANFERQMQILATTREVFSLFEFASAHKSGNLPLNAVAVTFDDGYVDNLLLAKPVLKGFNIPATVFIVSDTLDSFSFWWDRLDYAINFSCKFPIKLDLLRNKYKSVKNLNKAQSQKEYLDCFWLYLRDMTSELRDKELDELEFTIGFKYADCATRPLTIDELNQLQDDSIEIGCHTATHSWLPEILTLDLLGQEIHESRTFLQKIIGYQPRLFAYPYGAFTELIRDFVCQSGYVAAVTTLPSSVDDKADIYSLPRFTVSNCMNHFSDLVRI